VICRGYYRRCCVEADYEEQRAAKGAKRARDGVTGNSKSGLRYIVPRTYMFALRLAEFMTSVLKFKPGRLRGHAVVIDRHSQKVISPTVAQFSHRATRYSPVMIDLAMRDIWGSVLHTFAPCLLTLKPPNRLSVPLATPARRGPTPRPPLGSGLSHTCGRRPPRSSVWGQIGTSKGQNG
jgi:hypothetical protein